MTHFPPKDMLAGRLVDKIYFVYEFSINTTEQGRIGLN
jgi:hypothetical protein